MPRLFNDDFLLVPALPLLQHLHLRSIRYQLLAYEIAYLPSIHIDTTNTIVIQHPTLSEMDESKSKPDRLLVFDPPSPFHSLSLILIISGEPACALGEIIVACHTHLTHWSSRCRHPL